jgi:hypothetical protein
MVSKTPYEVLQEVERRQALEAAKPLCGTVIRTEAFECAINSARTTVKTSIDPLTILVRSSEPEQNLSEKDERENAKPYELDASYVTKISCVGSTKIRFQEIASDKYVVIIKLTSGYWRVCSSDTTPTGRRADKRIVGRGPLKGTS